MIQVLGSFGPCVVEFVEEMSSGRNLLDHEDTAIQNTFVPIINTMVAVLGDTRLPISKEAVSFLFVLFMRVSQRMSAQGNCWVWAVQEGRWFLGVVQSVIRFVLQNNTFRYETHDLAFLHSDAACTSTYREEMHDYRKSKAGELLALAHELHSQMDMAQKRPALWSVAFLCSDIERVAKTLQQSQVKAEKNFAMRRLEACLWAFAQLHEEPLVKTKCTMQLLATLRLICQIPYNAVLTTTGAIFLSCYVDVLDAGTADDVKVSGLALGVGTAPCLATHAGRH